jgi:hypothetical protein
MAQDYRLILTGFDSKEVARGRVATRGNRVVFSARIPGMDPLPPLVPLIGMSHIQKIKAFSNSNK